MCESWERRGCTHNLSCHCHMTVDCASLQSQDGGRGVFVGPKRVGGGSKDRSMVDVRRSIEFLLEGFQIYLKELV